MHENVFKRFPDADISASIVWIPILDNDSLEATAPSVKFLSDTRIEHFYDQDQIVGKEIANTVGWDGHIAWDIYLFYGPHVDWKNMPPKPTYCMHQLTDSWADREHYHTGDDLVNELLMTMQKLL